MSLFTAINVECGNQGKLKAITPTCIPIPFCKQIPLEKVFNKLNAIFIP